MMSNYITCEGCQRLIDLYPPPIQQRMAMWPSPTIFDTTVIIDGGRFCEDCGKSRLLGKDIVKGYRVDDGSVLGNRASFTVESPAGGHTLTYTGPVPEGLPETTDTQSLSGEQPELKFEDPK